MPVGPGKYDLECSQILVANNATAVVLMVIGGDRGSSFSITSHLSALDHLPEMLRLIAAEIEADRSK